MTRPIANADPDTQAWWDGTTRNELLIQRCDECGHRQLYPRALCIACAKTKLSYETACGDGAVHSFTIVHRAPNDAFTAPYVVALVRLDEGVIVMSNIVGCEPAEVRCEMPVRVTWEDLPDGRKLPLFEPME